MAVQRGTGNVWHRATIARHHPEADRICAACGKVFNWRALDPPHPLRVTCSKPCAEAHAKALRAAAAKAWYKARVGTAWNSNRGKRYRTKTHEEKTP